MTSICNSNICLGKLSVFVSNTTLLGSYPLSDLWKAPVCCSSQLLETPMIPVMSGFLNVIRVDRKIWLFLIEDSHLWYNSSCFFWGLPSGLFFCASSHPCLMHIFFSYFTVWKHSADQFTETVIHSKGQTVLQYNPPPPNAHREWISVNFAVHVRRRNVWIESRSSLLLGII